MPKQKSFESKLIEFIEDGPIDQVRSALATAHALFERRNERNRRIPPSSAQQPPVIVAPPVAAGKKRGPKPGSKRTPKPTILADLPTPSPAHASIPVPDHIGRLIDRQHGVATTRGTGGNDATTPGD